MFIKVKLPWDVIIPAEDMDTNGLMLQRAVVIRLLKAFASKKATKDLGYFITPTILEKIGEDKINEQTGENVFSVVFSGICFKIFKGEILHGVVHKVHKLGGVFLRSGPYETIYLSHLKMPGYEFIPGESPIFMNQNMSRIQIGATVRFIVLDTEWREAEREFMLWPASKETILARFKDSNLNFHSIYMLCKNGFSMKSINLYSNLFSI